MEVLESLIGAVRRCCAAFPDQRTGTNVRYAMPDIGMGAFSLFFVQSPSFLDFQRRLEAGHGRSNCQTLFGMSRIPTDNHIRASGFGVRASRGRVARRPWRGRPRCGWRRPGG